jgi:hypothetical protein
MRIRYLVLPLLLAGCVQKLPQDAKGDYLTLINVGKNGDVCEVLTDGGGKPVSIRGSVFAKPGDGCIKAKAYTSLSIKQPDELRVTPMGAEVYWRKSGMIKITVTKYGLRRHVWIEEKK